MQSAKSRIRSARGDYYPQIFAQGQFTYNDAARDLQLFLPEQQWNAVVGLQWNLFEGFKTDARVAESHAALMQSSARAADARLRIKQEVADTQVQVLKNRDSVELSQSLSEAAKEKFYQAQKRYEYGLSDFIELQQARQGYIDATANLLISYYDFYIALAALDRAVGR